MIASPRTPKSETPDKFSLSLGTYAQKVSAPADAASNRKLRYRLLREATYILSSPIGIKRNGKPRYEKMTRCRRFAVNNARYIEYVSDGTHASARGLEICDSPFCPVCGIARAEQARRELAAAAAAAVKRGWRLIMLTFTTRHDAQTPLKSLLKGQSEAFTALWQGRPGQWLKDEYSVMGFIRAKEPTYGKNGFHPHMHVLMMVDLPDASDSYLDWFAGAFRNELSDRWMKQLAKRGLDASDERGVDVKVSDEYIANYIAKFGREPADRIWDVSDELARSHAKNQSKGGLTPLQLLGAAAGVNDDAIERLREVSPGLKKRPVAAVRAVAADLWAEVYTAYKGDHMLRWSHGLKKLLDVENELKALEAADQQLDDAMTPRFLIHVDDWKQIVPSNDTHFALNDPRPDLLSIALADEETIRAYCLKHSIPVIVLSQNVTPSCPPTPPYTPLNPKT